MSEMLSGAEILCRALVDAGVEVIFGYPGGAIMPFYHALPDHPRLRHILVRHEQAAAHAADGYARASGRVGVCVATSGPGATNLVTGLAAAYMDSSPVVAITGQVSRPMIGRGAPVAQGRARSDPLGGIRGSSGPGGKDRDARHHDSPGDQRLPGRPPPAPGHARHARRGAREPRDPER